MTGPDDFVKYIFAKDLLLQVVPEADVIQPKPRTDVKDNSRRINQQPYLQPVDSPRTVHGRHRLGKVRLDNVNGTKEEREEGDEPKTVLHQLPNIERPSEETKLITDDILVALGDQHSQPFYALVAAKIPEGVIRQKLSEIKQGKTRSPARVFTSAMKAYATAVLKKKEVSSLMSVRKDLFRIYLHLKAQGVHVLASLDFLVLRPGLAAGPGHKKPRGCGVKAVEVDGLAGSERVYPGRGHRDR